MKTQTQQPEAITGEELASRMLNSIDDKYADLIIKHFTQKEASMDEALGTLIHVMANVICHFDDERTACQRSKVCGELLHDATHGIFRIIESEKLKEGLDKYVPSLLDAAMKVGLRDLKQMPADELTLELRTHNPDVQQFSYDELLPHVVVWLARK